MAEAVKAIRLKVAGGRLVELAEVCGDSDLRRRELAGRGGQVNLSLSLSCGVEPSEADSSIDAQLAEVLA